MMKRLSALFCLCVFIVLVSGCRGERSEKPPFHLNPNMDFQAKFKAQSFPQAPPAGTMPWGSERSFSDARTRADASKFDTVFYKGKHSDGSWVEKIPVEISSAFLSRGEERFNIYCAVCHDKAGTGKGLVIQRGFAPAPSFSDARIIGFSDGQLFDVISHGVRNMPAYRKQIPEQDRWAIVAHLRVLQQIRTASLKDVPHYMKSEIQ
jgi:mono/diheme cytochrome c family protein